MAQCITQLLVPTSIQNSQIQLSETGVLYWLLHAKFVENKLTLITLHIMFCRSSMTRGSKDSENLLMRYIVMIWIERVSLTTMHTHSLSVYGL